jgi:hypothetical protein
MKPPENFETLEIVNQILGAWILEDQHGGMHYQLNVSIRDGAFEINFLNTFNEHNWLGDISWNNDRLQFCVEYYEGEDYEDWTLIPVSSTEMIGELHGEEMILYHLLRTSHDLAVPDGKKVDYFPIEGDAPGKLSGTWQRSGRISQVKVRPRSGKQCFEVIEHDDEELAEVQRGEWKDDSLHLRVYWPSTKWLTYKRLYFKSDDELLEELKFEQTYRFVRPRAPNC